MSHIAKAISRYKKAQNPNDPFPADRIFPGVKDEFLFFEELLEFCEGFVEVAEENERLARQIRDINI